MRILILEDDENRVEIFKEKLSDHELEIVDTADEAIRILATGVAQVVFLDHDLGGEIFVDTREKNTGSEVVRFMKLNAASINDPAVIIHSMNLPAAMSMEDSLKQCYREVYRIPFTKLIDYFDDPSFLK